MNNKYIAFAGLPNSGKTTLLTALCVHRDCTPLNSKSRDFMCEKFPIFKSGDWSKWTATDVNEHLLNLEFELTFKGQKVVFKSRDFAGETWKKFGELGDDQEKSEIGQFLKDSSEVVVCFDLQAALDNEYYDYKQRFFVHNIYSFCRKNKYNIGLVVTKYDAVKDYVNAHGGLLKVLKSKLGSDIVNFFDGKELIFDVSSAEFEFDPNTGSHKPLPEVTSKGLGKLEYWLYETKLAVIERTFRLIRYKIEDRINQFKEKIKR